MPIKRSAHTDAVDRFLRGLDHPLKPAVEALRAAILGVSRTIGEEIKWNSPSFYVKDHFATINIGRRTKARPADHILVILHRGARAKTTSRVRLTITDPDGLLEWLAKDRCAVTFYSLSEVKAKKGAFQEVVRQWVDQL